MVSTAEKTVKRMLRTRGVLAAAVTTGGVALFMIIGHLLAQAIGLIGLAYSYGLELDVAAYWWAGFPEFVFVYVLPISAGLFLSFWFIAPVSELLGLGHVITRTVLAAGVASTLYFIVKVLVDVIVSIVADRPLLADSFPSLSFNGPGILAILAQALQGALSTFVSLLPLAVLAGILLWHWRKANPPTFHVEGLIDV